MPIAIFVTELFLRPGKGHSDPHAGLATDSFIRELEITKDTELNSIYEQP